MTVSWSSALINGNAVCPFQPYPATLQCDSKCEFGFASCHFVLKAVYIRRHRVFDDALTLGTIRALQEAPSTGTQVWGTYSNVETFYPGHGIPANGFGASCDPGARFPHPRLCPEFGITQCQVFGVFLKIFLIPLECALGRITLRGTIQYISDYYFLLVPGIWVSFRQSSFCALLMGFTRNRALACPFLFTVHS